jgi:hypothetical protein
MNKQKPPVPKALEGGARSRKLRAQAGYKSQVLHGFTVADDPRFVKWASVCGIGMGIGADCCCPARPCAHDTPWSSCKRASGDRRDRSTARPLAVLEVARLGHVRQMVDNPFLAVLALAAETDDVVLAREALRLGLTRREVEALRQTAAQPVVRGAVTVPPVRNPLRTAARAAQLVIPAAVISHATGSHLRDWQAWGSGPLSYRSI